MRAERPPHPHPPGGSRCLLPGHDKGEGNLQKEEVRLGQPISQDAWFPSGQNPAPWVPPAPGKGLSLGMEKVQVEARAWSSAFPFSRSFFGFGFPTCCPPARRKAMFPEASQQRKHPKVPSHPSPPATAAEAPGSHHRRHHPAQPPAALRTPGDRHPTAKPPPWGFWGGSHADPHLAKPFAIIPPRPCRAGADAAGGGKAAAAPAAMPIPK